MALADSFDGIIFDYGGVLVRHQTEQDQAALAALAGVQKEPFTELYWSLRDDYDKDLITAAEYWSSIAKQAGAPMLDAETVERLTDLDTESWMRFDPVMWDWAGELRAGGKPIAMLSNMPRDLGEALKSRTDRLDVFNQVTLSYELRTAKPEPAIYEYCVENLGTPVERTLFLDDRMANIQGAEMLGMRGIQFLDRDHVLLQLRA